MKLKKDYVLRQIAGSWVVIPMGQAALDFNGMLSMNETGAVLWKALEAGGDATAMAQALQAEYDVTFQQAFADAENFLRRLEDAGCLEQEETL